MLASKSLKWFTHVSFQFEEMLSDAVTKLDTDTDFQHRHLEM